MPLWPSSAGTVPSASSALQRGSARGKFKIGNDQFFDELQGAYHDGAVLAGDHGVAVENQLVLAADEVDIGKWAARLPGAPPDQVAAYVVLVALVRAGVDHRQQAGVRLGSRGDRPAVLPQVFTDGNRDVDAADAQHVQFVAGLEIAVLVEDPVVGQVMLRVGTDHLTLVQHCGDVLWVPALGMVGLIGAVQISRPPRQDHQALRRAAGRQGD